MSYTAGVATIPTPTPKCWFCPTSETSSALKCTNCKGAQIPTHDSAFTVLQWNVYSFGNDVPATIRLPASAFQGVLGLIHSTASNGGVGVAIRIAHGGHKYILVRHPLHDPTQDPYPLLLSIKRGGTKRAVTKPWRKAPVENRRLFEAALNDD
ncbi:hypothetical protein DL95DRAFT_521691 [Leptodontidium sp. 2 PMI_412]|nr:hypothetical protein DL95DRAFT_521691 [Leptodontidium sp. 2 PMI_412]